MPTDTKQILKEALELPAIERASLADQLLSSLDQPDGVRQKRGTATVKMHD
jgi:hypothetical protein